MTSANQQHRESPYDIAKKDIAKSFNKAANSYHRYAQLPNIIGGRLFERLDLMVLEPKTIIDLGSATGNFTRNLQQRYSKSKVLGLDIAWKMGSIAESQRKWLKKERYLCADAENIPLTDNSVDLVFSNLMLYWLGNPDPTLQEIGRVLKPGGLVMFTSFGPDTLKEMRESARHKKTIRVNRFMDMHDIGDGLTRAGFGGVVMDSENITMTYESLDELHSDLRGLGETNLNAGRNRSLTGKSAWNAYIDNYEKYRNQQNQLPASWEVIYGHAWASEYQTPKGPQISGRIGIKTL